MMKMKVKMKIKLKIELQVKSNFMLSIKSVIVNREREC